jgi:transcriptional regulator with XRE-family HTH domain
MDLMESASFAMVVAMITSSQCRAARGLLDWTQQELADRAGVGVVTVRQFEGELNEPRRATLEVIGRALEAAGVEFIQENGGGPGVRFQKHKQTQRHRLQRSRLEK